MGIEIMYKHPPGQDLEITPVDDFVSFVEGLEAKKEHFVIFKKTTGTAVDERAIMQEGRNWKPLIGYGGRRTVPFISDPEEEFRGALAIADGKLVYSEKGIPLHKMRDSYTWGAANERYYVDGGFLDIVDTFVDRGYHIFYSPDLRDYRKDYPFTTAEQITLKDIVKFK
jgi:hypothetical protein